MENVPFYFQSSDEQNRDVSGSPPIASQPQQPQPPKKKRKLIQLSTVSDPFVAELQSVDIFYLDRPRQQEEEPKPSLVQAMLDEFSVRSSESSDSEGESIVTTQNQNLAKDFIQHQQQQQKPNQQQVHESSDHLSFFFALNQDFFRKRQVLFSPLSGWLSLTFKRNKIGKSYTLHFEDQFVLLATKRLIENSYVISSCELGQDYYPFYVADLKASFFKSSFILAGKNLDSKNSKYYADDTLFSHIESKHTAVNLKNSKAGLLGAKSFDTFGLSYYDSYSSCMNPSKHVELGSRFKAKSVKNTVLVNKLGEAVLVFAKCTSTCFSLEIRQPLSMITAFGTAVAICHSTSQ